MAETATVQSITPAMKANLNRCVVHGRIQNIRRHEGTFYYEILSPAEDQYERPNTYEVSSDHRLGDKGDEITVSCHIRGYFQYGRTNDRDTGEIVKTKFFKVQLTAS